jgi:hypothetical protein
MIPSSNETSFSFSPLPNGRWFAAPQNELGARKLRAALVETLVSVERGEETGEESTEGERRRKRVQAIRERLGELMKKLQENLQQGY